MKMNRIFPLFFIVLCLFSQSSHSECTKLIDVIGIAAQNNGIVMPLEREHAVFLHYLRIVPFEVVNSDAKFYIEDRSEPMVRLFTMKNGCADLQWMIPRDFLALMGFKRLSV